MRLKKIFDFLKKIKSLRGDNKIRLLHPISWLFFTPFVFIRIVLFLFLSFWNTLKEIWQTRKEFCWW